MIGRGGLYRPPVDGGQATTWRNACIRDCARRKPESRCRYRRLAPAAGRGLVRPRPAPAGKRVRAKGQLHSGDQRHHLWRYPRHPLRGVFGGPNTPYQTQSGRLLFSLPIPGGNRGNARKLPPLADLCALRRQSDQCRRRRGRGKPKAKKEPPLSHPAGF